MHQDVIQRDRRLDSQTRGASFSVVFAVRPRASRPGDAGADSERAGVSVEHRGRSDRQRELVGSTVRADAAMSGLDPAEHRYSQSPESVTQNIQHTPAAVGVAVEPRDQPEGDTSHVVEHARPDDLGELAVHQPKTDPTRGFEEEDRPVQPWQANPDGAGDRGEVPANQRTGRPPSDAHASRHGLRVGADGQRLCAHQELTDRRGRLVTGEAPVDRRQAAVPPKRQVQEGDVAEPDERLRISAHRVEVDVVGDAVRAGTAPSGDDRPHPGITERIVQVAQSVAVGSRHVPVPVQGVVGDLHRKTPALQNRHRFGHP